MDGIGLRYNRKKMAGYSNHSLTLVFFFFSSVFLFYLALLIIVNLCLTCILTWQVKLKDAIYASFVRSHC